MAPPRFLVHAFHQPSGLLGRIAGRIMARTNRACASWTIAQLMPKTDEAVLEIGFGPGIAIELLVEGGANRVFGIDCSQPMLRQATRRNEEAIRAGRVQLQVGLVETLPFADDLFDGALGINSFQAWSDPSAGLDEIRRVLKPNGRLALGFNPFARQLPNAVCEAVDRAGFKDVRLVHSGDDFCVLAQSPG